MLNTDILEKILEATYIAILVVISYWNVSRTGKLLLHNDSVGGVSGQHYDCRDHVAVKK